MPVERWLTALYAIDAVPVIYSAATGKTRCLILACGNTLRCDDGLGPRLAEWAEVRFQKNDNVRVIARHQWTPELAGEIAASDSVLFIDASVNSRPGRVSLVPVPLKAANGKPATHHLNAPELLSLALELYGSRPAHAMLLTVGVASTDLGESLSKQVEAAMPRAHGVMEKAVRRFLGN